MNFSIDRFICYLSKKNCNYEIFANICQENCSRQRPVLSNVVFACCLFVFLMILTVSVTSPNTTSLNPEEHMAALRGYFTPGNYVYVPLNHTFILTNKHICKRSRPYLIAVVPSREGNFEQRQAIRETYGTMSRDKVAMVNGVVIEHVVRFVFVVGTSDDSSVEIKIFKENKKYRDIVQVDMIDTYYNLTLKVLMCLKWVDKYCPSAKYVLKVDDDVFVHVGILLNQIHRVKHSDNGNVFGQLLNSSDELTVNRGPGKTGLTYQEYPFEILPPYSQGTSYTLSRDLVPKILKTAPYLPYLHLEDVFITGIIASQTLGAQIIKLNRTSNWRDSVPSPCVFAKRNQLAQTKMTPYLIRRTWNVLVNKKRYCL